MANIFSSFSRSSILLVLAEFQKPVCLNELAELSHCSLCATSAAVKALGNEKIVNRQRIANQVLFSLNRKHPYAVFIESMNSNLKNNVLINRAVSYQIKTKSSLLFSSQNLTYLRKIKKLNDHSRRAA